MIDLSKATPSQKAEYIKLLEIKKARMELEKCQRLVEFIKQAWHVLEPVQPYSHGWHMDALCEHLEAVTAGDITRLLINIPPGTSKSLTTAVFWPAWEWGPKGMHNKRYIGASHEEGLATRDNLKMRRLIQSDWYRMRWPEAASLTGDQNQKTYFENLQGGWRQSCPVTSMTGRRGDCVVGNAIISTDRGPLTAEEIVHHAKTCNALSFDHDTGELVYRPVQAVARSTSNEIYRVHTADGGLVECTSDHRFYTARGYVPAHLLSEGDVLLRAVRNACGSNGFRDEENAQARKGRSLLRSGLLPDLYESKIGKAGPALQYLWKQSKERAAAMLQGMRSDSTHKKGRVEKIGSAKHLLPDMQPRGETTNAGRIKNVLLAQMRRVWPFARSSRGEQPFVEGRGRLKTLRAPEPASVQAYPQGHFGEGWQYVRVLQRDPGALRSSHGSGHVQQHMGKSRDVVSRVSRNVAQRIPFRSEHTTVALVERILATEMVYDLQVEGTRNFFANGLLVHNCVIWDDPHSVEDAHSPQKLETANRVFRETLPTRVNNPDKSAIVIIMQRFNQKDVSGEIISSKLGYEHLCIPMRFEEVRKPTKIGWVDPRHKPGELLFPARFPEHVVQRDEKIMGEYAVAGQFQQRPSPAGGGILKSKHFRMWPANKPLPDLFHIVQSYDTAFTEKTTGDPSGCCVWGVFEFEGRRNVLLLDAWDEHLSYPKLKEKVMDDWTAQYGGVKNDMLHPPRRPDTILIEAKGSGQSLLQDLHLANIPAVGYNPGRADKITRAHITAPLLELGVFWVMESKRDPGRPISWARRYLEYIQLFPAGDHDEYVDCTTQAAIYLRDTNQLETAFVPDEEVKEIDYHAQRKRLRNPYG